MTARTTTVLAPLLLGFALLALAPVLGAAEVAVLLTRIEDGDAKRARQEQAGRWTSGIHQDDDYTLLKPGAVTVGSDDPGRAVTISMDRAVTFQGVLGLGGAMTDSAAHVLMQLKAGNPELYAHAMRRLFSPVEGAGFSVLRLAMGASDYVATGAYFTYCDQESMTLDGFSIARDQESIIPVLRDAFALNPDLRLIATPWSPPAWMKTNRSLLGVSMQDKAAGATNTLRRECFAVYADYFVKTIEAYRASGLPLYAVTLQNEPQFDAAAYPCLRMDEADQVALIRLLGPKLAERGLATRIFIHDHNWVLHPNDLTPVGGDAKLQPLDSVATIMSDPGAAPFIAGSAWHCYSGGVGDMQRVYAALQARFPGRQILTTELSGWGRARGAWWGDVEWGMAHCWLGPFLHGSEASLEWNLALDHRFGPTLRRDSQAMGLITIRSDDWQSVRFEREFYAMAQVSRAARPGARRLAAIIAARVARAADGLDACGFLLADGRTSLVVCNRRRDEVEFQIADGRGFISYRLPGRSIATFCW